VEPIDWISDADRAKIFEGNARRVFSRFGTRTPREVNASARGG